MPRPKRKGRRYTVTIDSSPQMAAIYLDDKAYGIIGYTPYKGKLVKGDYKLILELQGYKTIERPIRVERRSRTFFVPLEKQVLPGTIDVQAAADPNVMGAQVFVDGQPHGTVPNPIEVTEGRHLVEIRKQGFHEFQQWVTIQQGQRVTLTPMLRTQAAPKGALLIDADVPEAEVHVDGKPQADTTPVLVEGLDEGPHIIEVKKAPAVPWKQTVYVKAGERAKVTATLAATLQQAQGGNVRVLANVPSAEVWLDGTLKGQAPLDLTSIAPGVHIIEVKAKGYDAKEERVTVNAGQATILKLDLARAAPNKPTTGKLKVVSPVPEARVFIDGAAVGTAPAEKEVTPGEHFVTVEREGYSKFEQRVRIEAGDTASVTAALRAVGGLRFLANVDGADVYLDGQAIGKTPMVREVEVGDHVVSFRKEGYHAFEQPIKVEGGQLAIVNANLRYIETSLTAEEISQIRRGLSSWGAKTMPYGRFTVDAALGYPYWVETKATVGVHDSDSAGWDIGVGFRTFLTTWEFLGTLRYRIFHKDPFALALFGTAGGGGGLDGRNQFTGQGGAAMSITFTNLVTVSGRAFVDLWSDRLCAEPEKGMTTPSEGPGVCTGNASPQDIARAQALTGNDDLLDRDVGARLYLSMVLEAAVDEYFSIFGVFEGAPFQDGRAAHSRLFNATLLSEDDPVYNGKVGVTFKF